MASIVIKIWRFVLHAGLIPLLAMVLPYRIATIQPCGGGPVTGASHSVVSLTGHWVWLLAVRAELPQPRDFGGHAEGHGAPNALAAMGLYSVTAFGADPHGRGDSTAAIQRAVDAACSEAGLRDTKPTVFFPAGRYNLFSGPVIDNCACNITFAGVDRNSTVLDGHQGGGNTQSPLLLAYPSTYLAGLGTLTTAPLVGSTGNSINFPSGKHDYYNLGDVLNIRGAQPLNGLAHYSVETFIDPGSASGIIFSSAGVSRSGTSSAAELGIWSGAAGCELNVGGRTYNLSGGKVTAGTIYWEACTYDGSKIRLYLCAPNQRKCAPVATRAATGSVTQAPGETMLLGGTLDNGWPDGGVTNSAFKGQLYSVHISKSARYVGTLTNAPGAAFAGDGNTLLLINGDKFNSTYGTMGVDYLNGSSNTLNATLIPRRQNPPTQGAAPVVKDLTLTHAATGLMIINDPAWSGSNLLITSMSHAGIILYSGSYSGQLDHIGMVAAGIISIENDSIFASEVIYDAQITGSEYALVGPEAVYKLIWTPNSAGLVGVYWTSQTATSNGLCSDCLMDVENGGSAIPFKVSSASGGTYQIIGGDLQTNAAFDTPGVSVGGNIALTLIGTHAEVNNDDTGVIRFAGTGATGARVVWINPVINGRPWTRASKIPLTNVRSQVAVITGAGVINPCSGVVALAPGNPSTATVTNACVTTFCQCTDQTAANAIKCSPTPGTYLGLTGPNNVSDTIAWECQ